MEATKELMSRLMESGDVDRSRPWGHPEDFRDVEFGTGKDDCPDRDDELGTGGLLI